MDEVVIKENQKIVDMIYEVRGVQVMLSSDVTKLYQVETKRINEVIKRNIKQIKKEKIWVIMLRLMARLVQEKVRLPNGLRKKKDIYM